MAAGPRASVAVREEVQREFEQWFGELKYRIGRKAHRTLPPPLVIRNAAGTVEEVVDVFSTLFREEESCRRGIDAAADGWLAHIVRSFSLMPSCSGSGSSVARRVILGSNVVNVVDTERRMRSGVEASEMHWRQHVAECAGQHLAQQQSGMNSLGRSSRTDARHGQLAAIVQTAESAARRAIESSEDAWRRQQGVEVVSIVSHAAARCAEAAYNGKAHQMTYSLFVAEGDGRRQIIAASDHQLSFLADGARHGLGVIASTNGLRKANVLSSVQSLLGLAEAEQTERKQIELARTGAISEISLLWQVSAARGAERCVSNAEQCERAQIELGTRVAELQQTETRWRWKIDRSFGRWVTMIMDELEMSKRAVMHRDSIAARAQRSIAEAAAGLCVTEERERRAFVAGVDDWLKFCAAQFDHETRHLAERLAVALQQSITQQLRQGPQHLWTTEILLQEEQARCQIAASEASWRLQLQNQHKTVLALVANPSCGPRMKELADRESLDRLQIGVSEGKWRSYVLDKLEVALQRCSEKAAKSRHLLNASTARRHAPGGLASPVVGLGGLRMTDPF